MSGYLENMVTPGVCFSNVEMNPYAPGPTSPVTDLPASESLLDLPILLSKLQITLCTFLILELLTLFV